MSTCFLRFCLFSSRNEVVLFSVTHVLVGSLQQFCKHLIFPQLGLALVTSIIIIKFYFEEWLQRRDRDTYDRYRAQRAVVKKIVKVVERMTDWQYGPRLWNYYEKNIMTFWKEVKRERKGEQARDEMVKDVNDQILRDGVEVCVTRRF